MFTKDNTLKKNWEFQKILAKKKQIVDKHLIIYFDESEDFKIGISMPKQFLNAVKRNHFKNQVRAILRKMNDITDFLKISCVLIARKTFFDLEFSIKEQEIRKIFERIKDGKTEKI